MLFLLLLLLASSSARKGTSQVIKIQNLLLSDYMGRNPQDGNFACCVSFKDKNICLTAVAKHDLLGNFFRLQYLREVQCIEVVVW